MIKFTTDGIKEYYNETLQQFDNSVDSKEIDGTLENFFERNKQENDYQIIVHQLNNDDQKILWKTRLRHVCNVLHKCCDNLQDELGIDSFGNKRQLPIQLGIFGSNNVTSDIDIGVSYIKDTTTENMKECKLSSVVRKFEQTFLSLGYTSLDLDGIDRSIG